MNRQRITIALAAVLTVAGCATTPKPQRAPAEDVKVASKEAPSQRGPLAQPQPSNRDSPRPVVHLAAHREAVPFAGGPVGFAGPITVEPLVGFATANNPQIGAARAKAQAMISRVPQARSLDDPMLLTTAFLEQIQTAAGPQQAVVSLQQKLPWFGKLNARGEIAFRDAQVAFAEMADVQLTVVEQVKVAFYDLYLIDQSLRVYEELEPKIRDVIVVARTRYETNAQQVGLESVLQAEIELHKLQITITQLQQAKLKAQARLAQALHLPSGQGIDIEPLLTTTVKPYDVDTLVAMIGHCHPQLAARRQALARDNWSVNLAQRDYFPDLTLGFNWYNIGARGLSPVANGRDAYSVVLGVNLPIYRAKRDAAAREAMFKTARSAAISTPRGTPCGPTWSNCTLPLSSTTACWRFSTPTSCAKPNRRSISPLKRTGLAASASSNSSTTTRRCCGFASTTITASPAASRPSPDSNAPSAASWPLGPSRRNCPKAKSRRRSCLTETPVD